MPGESPDDDLEVGDWTIPSAELEWRFSTSGGPGGQHANRSNTRADLTFDLAGSDAFPADAHQRMVGRLGSEPLVVSVAESRSQFRNRMKARARLRDILLDANRIPKERRATRPTRSARRRRLEEKRARSETKQLRRRPDPD
ncbi:MAG TPA: alternative ribosome rescue aminoacyl-tRNA hydrolase ArfB [Acidimicrobiia bacterium]|nr:alternative ribosome rescue aminoacyl-tRNA hydrolase ArfB [Acidimicrobiia bacterium]